MPFILVADSLSMFSRNAVGIMPLHATLSLQIIQYADNTLIICEAHLTTLKIVNKILNVYTELSELQINREKVFLFRSQSGRIS